MAKVVHTLKVAGTFTDRMMKVTLDLSLALVWMITLIAATISAVTRFCTKVCCSQTSFQA